MIFPLQIQFRNVCFVAQFSVSKKLLYLWVYNYLKRMLALNHKELILILSILFLVWIFFCQIFVKADSFIFFGKSLAKPISFARAIFSFYLLFFPKKMISNYIFVINDATFNCLGIFEFQIIWSLSWLHKEIWTNTNKTNCSNQMDK